MGSMEEIRSIIERAKQTPINEQDAKELFAVEDKEPLEVMQYRASKIKDYAHFKHGGNITLAMDDLTRNGTFGPYLGISGAKATNDLLYEMVTYNGTNLPLQPLTTRGLPDAMTLENVSDLATFNITSNVTHHGLAARMDGCNDIQSTLHTSQQVKDLLHKELVQLIARCAKNSRFSLDVQMSYTFYDGLLQPSLSKERLDPPVMKRMSVMDWISHYAIDLFESGPIAARSLPFAGFIQISNDLQSLMVGYDNRREVEQRVLSNGATNIHLVESLIQIVLFACLLKQCGDSLSALSESRHSLINEEALAEYLYAASSSFELLAKQNIDLGSIIKNVAHHCRNQSPFPSLIQIHSKQSFAVLHMQDHLRTRIPQSMLYYVPILATTAYARTIMLCIMMVQELAADKDRNAQNRLAHRLWFDHHQ